jgi:hypothetical protein
MTAAGQRTAPAATSPSSPVAGAARAWARRHPEVTGRLLTRDGALGIGVAEFGALLQAAPRPGAQTATSPE